MDLPAYSGAKWVVHLGAPSSTCQEEEEEAEDDAVQEPDSAASTEQPESQAVWH